MYAEKHDGETMNENNPDTAGAGLLKQIVGIADMRISSDPSVRIITYSLGSCLGITAYDPEARVGGLLHVMLPLSERGARKKKAEQNPYMYVDAGVAGFLNNLFRRGAEKKRLVIKVAGGAFLNIGNQNESLFQIGKRNFLVLRKLLWKNDLLMKNYDVGGNYPRTMWLDIGTGSVCIKFKGTVKEL